MDVAGRKVVKTRVDHVCFGCGRKFCRWTMMERSCVFDGTPWTCYRRVIYVRVAKKPLRSWAGRMSTEGDVEHGMGSKE